jgi:hypothetical protein
MQLAGDTVAQMYENRQKGLTTLRPNMSRLRKAALVGVVNVGLWPYYWYREYRLRFPYTSLSSTLSQKKFFPPLHPSHPSLSPSTQSYSKQLHASHNLAFLILVLRTKSLYIHQKSPHNKH